MRRHRFFLLQTLFLGAILFADEGPSLQRFAQSDVKIKRVILFSTNPFLGDEFVFKFPYIQEYKRLLGDDVEIVFVSPHANHLNSNVSGLKPVSYDLSSYIQSPSLAAGKINEAEIALAYQKIIKDQVAPYANETTLIHAFPVEAFHGIWHTSGKEFGLMPKTFPEVVAASSRTLTNLAQKSGADLVHFPGQVGALRLLQYDGMEIRAKGQPNGVLGPVNRGEGRGQNVYEFTTATREAQFGPHSERKLSVEKKYLVEAMTLDEFTKWKVANKVASEKDFVLLNLNAGPDKKTSPQILREGYKQLVESFSDKYPDTPLVVMLPNAADIPQELLSKKENKIAFADFKNPQLVAALLENAKAIITQDTGLAHVAAARREIKAGSSTPEIMSFHIAGNRVSSFKWAFPGQPFIYNLDFVHLNSNEEFWDSVAKVSGFRGANCGTALVRTKSDP